MQKIQQINIRCNQEEYITISEAARRENSTISEYVRKRVLIELTEHGADFQKKLMKSVLQVHLLTKLLAKQSLSEDDYKNAIETSKKLMEKWGYE